MRLSSFSTRSAHLRAGVSILALVLSFAGASTTVHAEDIGSVDVESGAGRPAAPSAPVVSNAPAPGAPPIASDAAIGVNAPVGSAPALAVAQQSLNATEPGSVISGKILRDVVIPSGDYNEAGKFTPNFVSNNPNGPLGDSKSSWRGFQDGQFNITFDGIPFGDANNPSHHSAAYFPSAFLGQVVIDRGPGPASQVGYATFGGTMALKSFQLSDTFGGNVETSFGAFNTNTQSITVQSGYNKEFQTRALIQYEHSFTDGEYQYGHYNQNNLLLKIEKQLGDVTATVFGTYGTEQYNNVTGITYQQWQLYGKNYGAVNNNPTTQQYYGYNNSHKQTDMDYIDLKYSFLGFNIDNKAYTYAYWYPLEQNNAVNQTIEGANNSTNGGSLTTIKVPIAGSTKTTTVTINGVANGDVTGHLQVNNYRAYGDILNISRDLDYGALSGQLRFGLWYEFVFNYRSQPYIDYTTGMTYAQLGNAPNVSTILNLKSEINNVQPFIEYEWKPTDRLSITPGYKWEAFTRIHDAVVNQTTLAPLYYTGTYYANLPFLTARYKLTDEWTVYGQASKGFLAPTVSAFYVFAPTANSIQPQSTTNYQIGAVFKNRDITADFALYQQRLTNFPITYTYASQQTYENGGTARYEGAEFQGTYAFGKYVGMNGFAVTSALGLSNAKYVQGANTGLAVGDAPRYTAAGGLIYDDKTFFGSLLQKVTGDQYGSQGQIANVPGNIVTLNKVAAYASTDFVAGYRYTLPETFTFGKQLEFKLGVTNIFDHRAVADISGNPTGQTLTTTKLTYTFQAGRYIYGGFKFSF